ncbi:CG-1 domain-containing protein, partial [Helicosporidium sp. ATCC 50920]
MARARSGGGPLPLQESDPSLPEDVRALISKAKDSWLKNAEIFRILTCLWDGAVVDLAREAPVQPEGGLLFLVDRKSCRNFRRDGHHWRKKKDGRAVKETHEKLKVADEERLNCYYAHSDLEDALQRRSYWLLDEQRDSAVLMHYLCSYVTR